MVTAPDIPPTHPGEILKRDFLAPVDLSQNRLAGALDVNPRRVSELVNGKRTLTADTALRLARFFGVSPRFWLGLQTQYDLDTAAEALDGRLEREVQTRDELDP